MAKTDTTVGELVQMIERGRLRLPEMQRQYVWTSTRVRDLFDSLYRGYPTGTILAWEAPKEVPEREMSVEQAANGWNSHLLLLDGQQRLTSLSAVIRGVPLKVRGRRRPIEIAFNLDHPEGPPTEVLEVEDDAQQPVETLDEEDEESRGGSEANVQERIRHRTFVVASRALLADPHWVRVADVFDPQVTDWQLIKPLGISPDDPAYDRYVKRLQRVRLISQYPYVMQVLEQSLAYEEVAEIFVRVNSLGMKLRGSDLALAQITARWPRSLELFEGFQEECEDHWFNLDIGVLVRTLVVLATNQSRFATVSRIPVDRMKAAWEEAKEGLRFAINFLRQNAGIENESLLSSPQLIIAVARYAMLRNRQLTDREQKDLLQWLFVANAMGHYSASSETTLDADLALLTRGGGPAELLQAVDQQFGRTRFTERDFEHRSIRHGLFATAFLALRQAGARDWSSGLRISLTHQGRYHYIEAHHIFPKAVLSQAGHERAEINELANFAFVSGSKNRMLGVKTPDLYFPLIIQSQGQEALRQHAIPPDPELWKVENYDRFLEARRKALAAAVNGFLEDVAREGTATADPVALIDAGESDTVEFKETARLNVRTGQVDKGIAQMVVKSVAGLMNAQGGTLLIGVNDQGVTVGLEPDINTLERRRDLDGYEQYLRQILISAIGAAATSSVHIDFPQLDGQVIAVLRIPAAGKEVYVNDGNTQSFYLRVGNLTRSLPMQEAHDYARRRF